ncbi:MAG: ATP-binding protein [Methylomonas sp.]|jgi:two-component system osmolarity sensor histidine kinase EnvZ|uniref:HAMP domain-containing sensor histidine kinase n=1 Tax=Methylomonas sp. TaxID=418 RepID=UPI0025EC0E58|nr:ATP-binding protein [Methylomonas sp.]MCK9606342.1 ATP-binding protein [Methylomonas sp.]
MRRLISLFRSTAMTLAVGLLIFQIAAGAALFANLVLPLAHRSADDLADLLILSARVWHGLPADKRPAFETEIRTKYGLSLLQPQAEPTDEIGWYPYIRFLRSALIARLPGQTPSVSEDDHEQFRVAFSWAGQPMQFEFSKERITPRPSLALAWVVLFGILATLTLAWLLARRVTAPVAQLAVAARRIANAGHVSPLPETGCAEFIELARVFNETARQLQAQRENQTTLLAGVSHDLRSPLARMKMAVGLLAEQTPSPLLLRMERDIAEMDNLIGAQLELARAQEGEPAEPVDLDELLQDAVEAAQAQAPGRVYLRAKGDSCLAELAPVSLCRCIGNLLENALRYGGEDNIQVVRRCIKGRIFIGVRDRGPGIPPQLAEQVFRPFYRLESSRNRISGGSGLGLAITRQLAETQGWKIAIKSRWRGGASVWLQIF